MSVRDESPTDTDIPPVRFVLNFQAPEGFFLSEHFAALGAKIRTSGFERPEGILQNHPDWWNHWLFAKLAWKAVGRSEPGEILVGWCFDLGLWLRILSLARLRPRTVVAHNLIYLAEAKQTLPRKLKRHFLSWLFGKGGFFATVNSLGQVREYAGHFGVSEDRFEVVHDSFDEQNEVAPFQEGDGSVYCGGMSYRDWRCFFAVAKLLPHRTFVGVASRSKAGWADSEVPQNVRMAYDVPEKTFYDAMRNAGVVCLPLTTYAPAGLIVLIRAAHLNKALVTTRTPPTTEFVIDGKTGFLAPMGDPEAMAKHVERLCSDPDLRRSMAASMTDRLPLFSPQKCAESFAGLFARIGRRTGSGKA